MYDHPFQWGSRRVGPDLAREGGRQSHLWHYQHLERPTAIVTCSTMPNYVHLLTTKLNFKALPERVKAASLLGAKYDFDPSEAGNKAREQANEIAEALVRQGGPKDKAEMQVIALIAYLQRLGTDINRPDLHPRWHGPESNSRSRAGNGKRSGGCTMIRDVVSYLTTRSARTSRWSSSLSCL